MVAKTKESKVTKPQTMTKSEFIDLMYKTVGDLRETNEPINTGKVYMLADMLDTAAGLLVKAGIENVDSDIYKGIVKSLLSKDVSVYMDGDICDTTVLVLDTNKVREFQADQAEEM
jgi:hypothetical protein